MSNNITKTIKESISEVGTLLSEVEFLHGVPVQVPQKNIDAVKSHLLQSQIKVIESWIEGMRLKYKSGEVSSRSCRSCFQQEGVDIYQYNKALEDQISSLNETLEELKKSL